MDYEVLHKPSYALARIRMNSREQLQAETGAMVSMSDSIKMETSTRGGLFGGLRRSVLGGESFFVNTFTAEQPGEVTVAPSLPGDIEALELRGETLLVQSGSFLAATMNIEVDSQWGGARSFFSKEGLFLLRCSGTGLLFISSTGQSIASTWDAANVTPSTTDTWWLSTRASGTRLAAPGDGRQPCWAARAWFASWRGLAAFICRHAAKTPS